MQRFKEVPDVRSLAELIQVAVDNNGISDSVLNLLRDAPDADQYLRVELDFPEAPPGTMQMLVPTTRIYFNAQRCKELRGDAVVALAVYAVTQSTPAAFFAATVRKLHDNFSVLTENEVEVVREFFALSEGRPYSRPIEEAALQRRFAETLVPLDDVLDHLERRGVVAKRRGGKLILVF